MKVLVCIILLMLAAPGCLYTNIQRPLDVDFTNTDLGNREGRSSNISALWLVAWGDGGTKAAADDGGIQVIKHADREFFVILFGLYARVTTVVYGD